MATLTDALEALDELGGNALDLETTRTIGDVSDTGGADLDRLLDPNLPHTFRGLDPEAVQGLLTDAVESLRAAQRREDELRSTIASLESELATARAEATAELEQAKRRGRQMVTEAQTVRRRILEDLIRRRKVLRRQIEQLRVGRERLLEAYEVVGQTVEEATAELGVSLVSATAAAERAGRRLGPDADDVTEEELHAMEAEIDAARAAGLPIMDPPTSAERRAAAGEGEADEGDEDAVPPLVEVEPVVAAFEEMRVLGPVDAVLEGAEPEADEVALPEEPEPEPDPEPEVAQAEPAPEPEPDPDTPAELPLFDRLRAEPEPEPEPPLPDLIEAEPDLEVEEEPDPVAVLADDLSRRLRRALADEQNQVLDRLRQDARASSASTTCWAATTPGSCAWPPSSSPACGRRRPRPTPRTWPPASPATWPTACGPRSSARSSGPRADDAEPVDLARPVREAFRAWRTDRILPLATVVAAEALQRLAQ